MLKDALPWFFVPFREEFRQGKKLAFELLMFLSLAHFFGGYTPKQLADFLGIPHQRLYRELKTWRLDRLKKLLFRVMVHQAAEELTPLLKKSDAPKSRAGISLSVDNSVLARLGRLLRCTGSWDSGRAKQVVHGQDLLGIVLPLNRLVFPLHLLVVSKQGRATPDKPSLLISRFNPLLEAFRAEGIDITVFPIPLDSWDASDALKQKLQKLGFKKIMVAGKPPYGLTREGKKQDASPWKKTLKLRKEQWGIDVPSCRMKAESPPFGKIGVFFYKKSTTRNYSLMDFSRTPLRGAEIWHIWKHHSLSEGVWKILKSTFKIKEMRFQAEGLSPGLVIKILASLLAIRLKGERVFSNLSITPLMRKIQRETELETILREHFHLPDLTTQAVERE